MNTYDLAVLAHVVCAVLWVGGGIVQLIGAELVRRKRGPDTLLAVIDVVALLGPVLFLPVSFLTLVTGATAAWMGPGFTDLWVLIGLAGYAATFLTGLFVIKPRAEAIAELAADGDTPKSVLVARSVELMTIARFDHVILFLVISVMVLKPAESDVGILAAMAVILVLGAFMTIVKGMRGTNPATA